jgi:hypothetical protein
MWRLAGSMGRKTGPSIDVERQPFLADHALPQRDLGINEGVELLGRAVGGDARHGLEAVLGLGVVEPELQLGIERIDDRSRRTRRQKDAGFSSGMVSQIGTSSGVGGLRSAEVMPSARSLSARTNSMPVVRLSKKNWVTPAVRSCGAGAAAIGDVLGLGAGELKEPGAREMRHRIGRHRGMDHQHVGRGDDVRHRIRLFCV